MSTLIRHFWQKHGSTVLAIVAVALIFVVAFKTGQLQKEAEGAAKINITLAEKKEATPADERARVIEETLERKGIENELEVLAAQKPNEPAIEKVECAIVASKNSTKYHLPNCKNATRIKDSNKVCFSSEEEAKSKGYEQAKCCFK
jgi:hypothetical protein